MESHYAWVFRYNKIFQNLIIWEHALFCLILPYISSFYYNTFMLYCELTINCETSTLPMTLAYYTDVAAPGAKEGLPSNQGFIGWLIHDEEWCTYNPAVDRFAGEGSSLMSSYKCLCAAHFESFPQCWQCINQHKQISQLIMWCVKKQHKIYKRKTNSVTLPKNASAHWRSFWWCTNLHTTNAVVVFCSCFFFPVFPSMHLLTSTISFVRD